jgi:seryl-tRNA synthetase
MLDLKRIRNNPEEVKLALSNRGEDFDLSTIDKVLALDEERRKILVEVENLKSKRNQESAKIPKLKKAGENVDDIMAEMKKLSDEIKAHDERLSKVDEEIEYIMLRIPNIPNPAVPEGKTDEDNVEIRRWGEPTKFNYEPKAHWDLGVD